MKTKKLIYGALALVAVAGGYYFYKKNQDKKATIVKLDEGQIMMPDGKILTQVKPTVLEEQPSLNPKGIKAPLATV